MNEAYIHRHRPRVSGEPLGYTWTPRPKRLYSQDYQKAAFEEIGTQKSDFIVSPEWVSEALENTVVPFAGRKYGPIPYEYPGARYWPFLTRENKERYDRQMRQYLRNKTVQEARVMDDVKRMTSPRVRVLTTRDHRLAPTSLDGYVVLADSGDVANNAHCDPPRPAGAAPRPSSVPYSRHNLSYENCRYRRGYEEYFDHLSPYNTHQPDDVAATGGSHIRPIRSVRFTDDEKRQAMTLRPDYPPEQRPRFTHPYLNTVNAMWIGSKFPDSPAQN